MQTIAFETGCSYTPRFHYQNIIRGLDSPAKAGGLAGRLHHPAGHILPLRLHAVKGRRLFPLTTLGLTALGAQWDGSSGYHPRFNRGSRRVTGLENEAGYQQACKIGFRKEDQLNFLQDQPLEEVDEANYEFESPS